MSGQGGLDTTRSIQPWPRPRHLPHLFPQPFPPQTSRSTTTPRTSTPGRCSPCRRASSQPRLRQRLTRRKGRRKGD
eukprot:11997899-Alexandrium_andersonii.AAC.1